MYSASGGKDVERLGVSGCYVEGMVKPPLCICGEARCVFCHESNYVGEFYCCITSTERIPNNDGICEVASDCPIREVNV